MEYIIIGLVIVAAVYFIFSKTKNKNSSIGGNNKPDARNKNK